MIVCGLHDVGLRVVEQLHAAGEPVVVVDDDPDPRLLRIVIGLGRRRTSPGTRAAARPSTRPASPRAAALVCTAADDLDNLEIALLARRIRPDLRVVVQLGNAAVGRAVAQVTGPASVLDVAGLAAPTLAEACLDQRSRLLDIGGAAVRARGARGHRSSGTLRALFGDLAPIAVRAGRRRRRCTSARAATSS